MKLALVLSAALALSACATIHERSIGFAKRVCDSGELATGLVAVDTTIDGLETLALGLELAGRPVPTWLPAIIEGLKRDRTTIAAGCSIGLLRAPRFAADRGENPPNEDRIGQ